MVHALGEVGADRLTDHHVVRARPDVRRHGRRGGLAVAVAHSSESTELCFMISMAFIYREPGFVLWTMLRSLKSQLLHRRCYSGDMLFESVHRGESNFVRHILYVTFLVGVCVSLRTTSASQVAIV